MNDFINSALSTWRADFYDRVRRQNYLVILLCMAVLTALFFPTSDDNYTTVVISGYRGIYNSQWIGVALAILSVSFLPIICFYLVKNAIEGDRNRQVCELIAATPVAKLPYLLGKWLANVSLLFGIIVVMSVAAVFVQVWHGESYNVDPLAIVLPQLLFVLPILMVISAIAVLFETVPFLRGGFGNVAYFFLWMGLVIYTISGGTGMDVVLKQIQADIVTYDPSAAGGGVTIGVNLQNGLVVKTFIWQGMDYGLLGLKSILTMLGISLSVVLAASVIFDRFKHVKSADLQKQSDGKVSRLLSVIITPWSKSFEMLTAPWAFTRLIRQECLLLLRGGSNWWYLALLGLGVAQLFVPIDSVRMVVIPASWLLCVLMFSPMGHREIHQGAEQLIFTAASPMKKQFPAMLLAGFLVAFLVVSPSFVRFVLTGELFSALMLLTGALFIPSFAIACGALTRTCRTFEILFTIIWYIGPLQRTPFDFVGVDPALSAAQGAPLVFLTASGILIAVALMARKSQMWI